MNKKEIKAVYPLLKIISKLNNSERSVLLKYLNHNGCAGIYECIDNGLCNHSVPEQERKKLAELLAKEKNQYRFIVKSCDPIARQKKLIQVGGSVGVLLETILPSLEAYLEPRKKRKKNE